MDTIREIFEALLQFLFGSGVALGMGSFTVDRSNKILDLEFGGVALSADATLYIGVSSTTITDSGGNITGPSGGNYARVAVTNNATNFPAASAGAKSNGTVIAFAAASAAWASGANMVDFFIANHLTATAAANIKGYGTLTTPKAVGIGDVLQFAVGELDITQT